MVAGRILVGVDGSEGSRQALAWASDDAAVRGAVVDAVTVYRHLGRVASDQMGRPRRKGDEARHRLSDLISDIATDHPDVQIQSLLLQGDPAETLCRLASDADLLVVGARGHGSFEALLRGSVADKCAHHSPGPIVIVPKHQADEPKLAPGRAGRIVVGVDNSEGSRHALEWAIAEAVARDWVIQAVTVWTKTYDYEVEYYLHEDYWPVDKQNEEDARLGLDRAIEEVAGTKPALKIEPLVLEGDPGQRLCELSESADLLVVGCRGHAGLTGLLLGSVASKCARHSPRPVVIVHNRDSRVEQASTCTLEA